MILPSSYLQLPECCYQLVEVPQSPRDRRGEADNPALLCWDSELAAELGLDRGILPYLSGDSFAPGAQPLALAYAGHQFGQFVSQLGDGRALLLGELQAPSSGGAACCWDIQLKGSGPTPFSRGGDGRLPLGAGLKEFLYSKALHALGVPTSRSLSLVALNLAIFRPQPPPGGYRGAVVLSRIAACHLRVGSLEYFAARNEPETVLRLADYLIRRLYPECESFAVPQRYCQLLLRIVDRQARLVALWQSLGFVHGVLNTDNTSLAGQTLDYGPCAFLDHYWPQAVFSSIDCYGRYAFDQQPQIVEWNLQSLIFCLRQLIWPEAKEDIKQRTEELLQEYRCAYAAYWQTAMLAKLGIQQAEGEADLRLLADFLGILEQEKRDYTSSFCSLQRFLGSFQSAEDEGETGELERSPGFESWLLRWRERLRREPSTAAQQLARLQGHNPQYIPRNSWLEYVLERAESGDLGPFEQLYAAVSKPYCQQPEYRRFGQPRPGAAPEHITYCGT